jgi:hypothetical protein
MVIVVVQALMPPILIGDKFYLHHLSQNSSVNIPRKEIGVNKKSDKHHNKSSIYLRSEAEL